MRSFIERFRHDVEHYGKSLSVIVILRIIFYWRST